MTTYDYPEKPKNTTVERLASIEARVFALIVDSLILGAIGGILGVASRQGVLALLAFVIGAAYHWYFLTKYNGQTPGKMLMGIRVVKATGEPLTASDAVLRYAGYYLNSFVFGLGWFWALFDANRRGWHDMLASTYVISTR